jgi:hypothetical protein
MPTYNVNVDPETSMVTWEDTSTGTTGVAVDPVFADDDCGNLDTPDAGDLNTAARKCAARRGWAMKDGSYPIRSKEMHGAADLAKAIKAVGRGGGSHDEIRQHIMKRARSLGLGNQIPENWTSSGSRSGESSTEPDAFQGQSDEDCPEGQVRDESGDCVTPENDNGDDQGYQASAVHRPPAHMFTNPALNRTTPLTVDDNGYVYGHLATWNECHVGIGNRCITAPRTATNYAYFTTGEVVCDDGSRNRVGKITLGTGHADPALGFIPAAEHYDNTGTSVAVVACGEDRFGIWVAGSLVPGLNEEKLAELRRSPLSGDWRRIGGNLELVAALAVNTPGFPVLRASADSEDELEVLLAAGVVTEPGEVVVDEAADRAKRWREVEDTVRSERVKRLLGERHGSSGS